MRRAACLGLAVVLLTTGCGSDDPEAASETSVRRSEREQTGWEDIDEIAYLLPSELPDGWTVKLATERPGRPREDWTEHVEVLADGAGSYLVLGAARTGEDSPPGGSGGIVGVPVDAMAYVFAYVIGADPTGLAARGLRQQADGLDQFVTHVAAHPDDALIQRVADDFASDTSFDFGVPRAALDAGYTRIGSSASETDVGDYTVSWAPAELAGEDRAAAASAPDTGPTLFVNVGARFYAQAATGADVVAEAPLVSDGETLQLEFVLDGSRVAVGGREVTESELRQFASSLEAHDRDAWVRALGDRLLVDEQRS